MSYTATHRSSRARWLLPVCLLLGLWGPLQAQKTPDESVVQLPTGLATLVVPDQPPAMISYTLTLDGPRLALRPIARLLAQSGPGFSDS